MVSIVQVTPCSLPGRTAIERFDPWDRRLRANQLSPGERACLAPRQLLSLRISRSTQTVAAITLLLVLAPYGCNQPGGMTSDAPSEGEELPIIAQLQDAHSHELEPMQLVIRDAGAYARIPLREMDVDFSREMLLVVTLGQRLSDQYSVRIDRVWREGGKLQVETEITRPPPGAPPVFASPYCIAKVRRCDLNVAGFSPAPPARTRTWGQSEYGGDTPPLDRLGKHLMPWGQSEYGGDTPPPGGER